jgi:hypothetical protein
MLDAAGAASSTTFSDIPGFRIDGSRLPPPLRDRLTAGSRTLRTGMWWRAMAPPVPRRRRHRHFIPEHRAHMSAAAEYYTPTHRTRPRSARGRCRRCSSCSRCSAS